MDNQNGGQSGAGSQNPWNQAAAGNAVSGQTHSHSTTELSSAEKQQQTVSSLARRKLLQAYDDLYAEKDPEPQQIMSRPNHQMRQIQPLVNNTQAAMQPTQAAKAAQIMQTTTQPAVQAQPAAQSAQAQPAQNYRNASSASPMPQIKPDDWRKYHTAWQQYYQKYYGEYYGKAAKDYVAKERLKYERKLAAIADKEQEEFEEVNAMVQIGKSADEQAQVASDFKSKIQRKVAKRAKKMRKSRHFVPLAIGFSVLIFGLLFQYNQVIIANAVAFMSPGGSEVNDISAIDPTVSASVHESPTLMIPKLNVEVPVTFGSKNDLKSMANAMTNGVAHFAVSGASAKPGEVGNFAVSGHSAGNVYEASNYKFIFSGLTRLEEGDLIYMDYNNMRYTYRVKGSKTVDPDDTGSLRKIASDNAGKPMITLITCTPLGTSKYRLLVYGEQIHPSYGESTGKQEEVQEEESQTSEMPKNSDSPLEQFWKWLTGQE